MYEIMCLCVSGRPLTEEIREALFRGGRLLLRGSGQRRKVKGYSFEGVIRTERREMTLGTFVGVLFEATVESESGTVACRFLVTPAADRATDEELDDEGDCWVPLGDGGERVH